MEHFIEFFENECYPSLKIKSCVLYQEFMKYLMVHYPKDCPRVSNKGMTTYLKNNHPRFICKKINGLTHFYNIITKTLYEEHMKTAKPLTDNEDKLNKKRESNRKHRNGEYKKRGKPQMEKICQYDDLKILMEHMGMDEKQFNRKKK